MAASQARFLSLTARQDNVEFEGQQINQQRVVLANKSAGMNKQALTMKVPLPPNENDFMNLTYSYDDTDGSEKLITDMFYNPEYNGTTVKNNYLINTEFSSTKSGYAKGSDDADAVIKTDDGGYKVNETKLVKLDETTDKVKLTSLRIESPYDYNGSIDQKPEIFYEYEDPETKEKTYISGVEMEAIRALGSSSNETGTYYIYDKDGNKGDPLSKGAAGIGPNGNPPDYYTLDGKTYNIVEKDDSNADIYGKLRTHSPYEYNGDSDGATKEDFYYDPKGGHYYSSKELEDAKFESKTGGPEEASLKYYTFNAEGYNVTEEGIPAYIEIGADGRMKNITTYDENGKIKTSTGLTVKNIKDDEKYNDAMQQYQYDQSRYDRQIADLNAKMEIIQAQDKKLELQLKQLDTEQQAIQTEKDAVKKVIDKNIEGGWKTFG